MTTETLPCEMTNVNTPEPALEVIPKTTTAPDGLSLQSLSSRVDLVETTTSLDDLMTLRENLSFMTGRIKELRDDLEARLMEWINANGAITLGTRRIFIGTKKDTKCKALKPALEALLDAAGGDWEAFAGCLSSNAIKYGAAKQVMDEATWAQHFEVVEKSELKDGEAKPIKQIVDMDTQFIKQRKPAQ